MLRLYRQLYPELDLQADDAVAAAWAATLATPARTVLLAECEGRPVGTADLTVLANAARSGRPYLLVENVVVDRGSRRTGVGRALLDVPSHQVGASRLIGGRPPSALWRR